LVLYLDSDTVTLRSIKPLVDEFLRSGAPVGLAAETDQRFNRFPVREAWIDGRIPDDFPRRTQWQSQPILNSGVLLAFGDRARSIGDRCLRLYDRLQDRFRFAEQTLLDSILYEDQIPVFPIPLSYNCFVEEERLTRTGRAYIDPVLLDGQPIAIRHFAARSKKVGLDPNLQSLLDDYAFPSETRKPPDRASASRCVVLVPVGGTIEPDCERGLHELERRGYQVRRAFGYSAIDFGRTVLASQALRDGFEELMWIDSDIGFHPDDVEKLRRHDLPISCGLYPKKDAKSFACHFLPGTKHITFGRGGGLKEVLYAGFGFVHTRRELYERVKERIGLPDVNQRFGDPITAWFLPEVVPDGAGWWYLAEDYAFCHRARRCGFRITADTTIRLSHVGRHAYCWESFGDAKPRYTTLELKLGSSSSGASSSTRSDAKSTIQVGATLPVANPPPPPMQLVSGPTMPTQSDPCDSQASGVVGIAGD
jgi:hypothetical protein